VKVSRREFVALWIATAILWITGALHFALGRTVASSSETWRPRLLALHGGLALLFLVVVGSLLPRHVVRAWRAAANRPSGSFAIGSAIVLAASGWLLYYAGDESVRAAAVAVHDVVGFALPALLLLHATLGRRWRRRFLARK
jgi:hypothetical protein